jgi:hypothetical protein
MKHENGMASCLTEICCPSLYETKKSIAYVIHIASDIICERWDFLIGQIIFSSHGKKLKEKH